MEKEVRMIKNKNKEKLAAYMLVYRSANREKLKAQTIEYRKKFSDKVAATSAAYRAANKEKVRVWYSVWQKANAAYCQARNWAREAAKLRATPAWANEFFIEEAYDLAARRTKLKSGRHAKWNVDHIVPLRGKTVCGLHVHTNLRVIPALENFRKKNVYWPDMP